MKESRAAQKSPDSQFKDGSVGSRLETENSLSFPSVGDLAENAPAETDHPFASNPVLDNRPDADSPELVRRQNSLARDRRTGFKVTDNVIYPES